MDLRIVWNEFGQNTPETQRIFAEGRAYPVLAGGGRVAFVEDEINHLQHGGQTGGKIGPAGDLKGNARFGERPLGPHDALGDGRFRDKEGARNLLRGQATEQAKRERHARLRGQDRMAGDEDETKQVVADVIVMGDVEIRHGRFFPGLKLATEFLMLALEQLVPPKEIDGAMLGGGHQPASGIVRNASLWPPLERGDESILRELFGQTNIPDDTSKAGDEPGGFDPPDRINRTM